MNMKKEKKEIEKILENMEQPKIELSKHQEAFRMTLLNTKKSAAIEKLLENKK